MNIVDILKIKFPNILFYKDVLVQDDGNGGYIKEWNIQEPQPTQADLDQWAIDLAPQYQFNQNKIANQTIYEQLDAIDFKSIRAIRENDTQRVTELEIQAAALRSQLLPVR